MNKILKILVATILVAGFVVIGFTQTSITSLIPPYPNDPTKYLNGLAQWDTIVNGVTGNLTNWAKLTTNEFATATAAATNSSKSYADSTFATPANIVTATNNAKSYADTTFVSKAGGVMTGELDLPELYTGSFKLYRSALTPIDAGTSLDFSSTNRYWSCAMTGNVTFATANLAAGKHGNVMITGVATNATLTFPATWIFIGYKPTYIAANKHADLYLKSTGATDAGVWAFYGEEQ